MRDLQWSARLRGHIQADTCGAIGDNSCSMIGRDWGSHLFTSHRSRLSRALGATVRGAGRLFSMWRRAFCACHHLSYGVNKIRAPSPANTATKPPMAMAISIISSWGDGGFDFAE